MTNSNDKINRLLDKLELLLKKQDDLSKEINYFRFEINQLKNAQKETSTLTEADKNVNTTESVTQTEIQKENTNVLNIILQTQTKQETRKPNISSGARPSNEKSDLEKFIGENLTNKIGIAITVIGVAIGAKYAIDHQLVSPVTRIILGYLTGLILLAFAIRLKKRYENFSAVLLSGSMAIMYFITYSAYNFYDLIPQFVAFFLMLIFTVFTVAAALHYNRQVIAHIGLVGAYAVPFLLSEGSGNVLVLFTYMAIINVGILTISFKKYWKPLYYSSFALTWLIYFQWYNFSYQSTEHISLALTFLTIFFATFYLTFLAYKLIQKEKYNMEDIILLLANSFVYYGIGYSILNHHYPTEKLLGLFTLYNALLHFIVSVVIYRQKLADRNLFFLVLGLAIVFVTITIPVQLNGNWVTLLWAGEAALLFWIGRSKNEPVYEKLSYPLMALAFFSLIQDWISVYNTYLPEMPDTRITLIFNINFFTSLLFIASFGFIHIINQNKKYKDLVTSQNSIYKILNYSIPAILLLTIYYTFRLEIATYWNQLYADSAQKIIPEGQQYTDYLWNDDLYSYKVIWLTNYTLIFVTILAFINLKKLKNPQLGIINLGLMALALIVFLTQGLYILSELRESFLEQTLSQYYHRSAFNIGIRYISFSMAALTLFACYQYIRQDFLKYNFKLAFDIFLHLCVIWIASSELINLMDMAGSDQSYKFGLSIWWGIYSLYLIALGIWKKKKHLRLGAIILFGITLIKLFFYDISHLNTLSKTILLVSLGVLLLIISFLYNKYKHILWEED